MPSAAAQGNAQVPAQEVVIAGTHVQAARWAAS